MKTKQYFHLALLTLLIFIFSSCSIESLFDPKYDECTGQEKVDNIDWENPEFYSSSSDNLTGHLKTIDEKHVCNFSFYLSDVCVASPINIDFEVVLNDIELEATGLSLNDVELSSYYKVFKEGEMPGGEALYLEELSYQQMNTASQEVYQCKDVLGLIEKIDYESIVDVEFQVDLSFQSDPENDPEGINGYFYYNFLQWVQLEVKYKN